MSNSNNKQNMEIQGTGQQFINGIDNTFIRIFLSLFLFLASTAQAQVDLSFEAREFYQFGGILRDVAIVSKEPESNERILTKHNYRLVFIAPEEAERAPNKNTECWASDTIR